MSRRAARRRQLLGPPDPVEESGHRAERVVHRDVVSVGLFQLLQHREDTRVAKMSLGNNSTGSRLIVASAAPVNMFDAPGPTDAVTANVCNRSRCRA
jgi:hypothetical protein